METTKVRQRAAGIYVISNEVTGRKYYGSTERVGVRRQQHLRDLRGGTHRNRHLQHAWNKYGEDAFRFCVLAYLEKDQLLATEQRLLDWAHRGGHCYNIARDSSAPMTGQQHSVEARRKASVRLKGRTITWGDKISAARSGQLTDKQRAASTARRGVPTGRSYVRTPEWKDAKSQALKDWWASASDEERQQRSRTGWRHSEETCKNMSAARRGRPQGPRSEETKARMRKPKSPEHRAAMSACRIGKPGRPQGEAERESKRQKMRAIWAAKRAAIAS